MKKFLIAGGFLALVLSGCGVLNNLIQPVNNPLGLEDRVLSVNLGPSQAATGNASATATFADITDKAITDALSNIKSVVNQIAFKSGTLTGTGCPATLPTTVTVNVTSLSIKVFNTSAGVGSAVSIDTTGSLTLTKGTSNYTVSNANIGATTISSPSTLLAILTAGGENTAQATATLNTTSNPDLAGCTLSLTFDKGSAKFNLF